MALTWNRHGKSRIRLVKVRRSTDPHDIVDLTIDVQLEGEFDAVYVDGDNRDCLATDTMKNTVYAFARHDSLAQIEAFGVRLADHFIAKPRVSRVRLSIAEQPWQRLSVGGRPHPHAFVQAGGEHWTTLVTSDSVGCDVTSGLTNLVVLKTTDSSFVGFPRDEFTTLAEANDRVLATSITATWTYQPGTSDYAARDRIRTSLVETFAAHDSRSVQHTL